LGVFTAVILVTTTYLRLPSPTGYVHAGDGFILLASDLLGPIAAIAAALGSALADLLAGYPIYIPVTFLIKGAMGLVGAFGVRKPLWVRILLYAAAELLMVAGYFCYEWFLYTWPQAVAGLPGNLGQGLTGVILALILVPLAHKAFPRFQP